jgi:spore coat polysaccharide biosynthesis protein SpsF
VVRLTGDNPLIDGSFLDWMIEQYSAVSPACDYMVASSAGGFPVGLSGEMFSFAALERAWHKDTNPAWREHVTPYIYRHPELFRLHALTNPVDLSHMRWTVDTPEDLAFVRQIYNHFGSNTFSWQDVLALLEQHPEWLEINRHIEQKKV